MAQRPKTEVRQAILRAAARTFAESGYERAALGDIVERAGTSIGNLYKYFAGKEALFNAFLPPGFGAELLRRVRAQVEALRGEPDASTLRVDHPYRRAAEDLLAFTMEHRPRVVFLLLRAEGTPHARFRHQIVRLLVDRALAHAAATYPAFAPTPGHRRALLRIYRAFTATLGAILAEENTERAAREALALQATYHLSGLRALFLERRRARAAGGRAR